MSQLTNALRFIEQYKTKNPAADKAAIQRAFVAEFKPTKRRSVFSGDGYSMRFSYTKGKSFSNTVLSLSALQPIDSVPLVVCVVSPQAIRFLLANSTFLKRISHSSHDLRVDNVRGSFNGTDIMSEFDELANEPTNFAELFARHEAFTWAENLERLVEATNDIVPQNLRFPVTPSAKEMILAAPERAVACLNSDDFHAIEDRLRQRVARVRDKVLAVAVSDNVNLRGNGIERLVTGHDADHALGDLVRRTSEFQLVIDIKSKLIDRASAPKAFNIDKMLEFHSGEGSVFAFLMVGINVDAGTVTARLIPVLDRTLLESMAIQHHWAGRGSRGVTQLTRSFHRVLDNGYESDVNVERGKEFLRKLIER